MKTEFCPFPLASHVFEEARAHSMTTEGHTIKHNPTSKITGVTLDERLKFDVYTDQIERKALRSLDLLRRVKETDNVNAKCMQMVAQFRGQALFGWIWLKDWK